MKKSPNQVDKHVGTRVRMRRMLLGMSQEKLGDALGLTFQQIQKYEKGTNRIGASRLLRLGGILGVPVAYFYEGLPQGADGVEVPDGLAEPPTPPYVADFLSTHEGVQLMKAFTRIKDGRVRRRIVDLVRELAGEETDAVAEGPAVL